MTDKLIMTTTQRDAQYAALENSIDAVTQEIADHKVMWGEEAIPSRAAQRQNLVLKEREHKDAMEMLQSLPMVRDGPVAYLAHYYIEPTMHTPADDGFDVVEPMTEGAFPVFASPQAPKPITAADVTDEILQQIESDWQHPNATDCTHEEFCKKAVAISYNAVIKNRGEAR